MEKELKKKTQKQKEKYRLSQCRLGSSTGSLSSIRYFFAKQGKITLVREPLQQFHRDLVWVE